MNGISPTDPDGFMQGTAAELDVVEHVPDEELHEIATRDGLCMSLYRRGGEPDWSGDDLTDRGLAARICAGCPVRLACLELELRTSGEATLGVWGALPAEDVRALYPVWRTRRQHDDVPDDHHGAKGGERAWVCISPQPNCWPVSERWSLWCGSGGPVGAAPGRRPTWRARVPVCCR